MTEMRTPRSDPCTRCGACCAAFRVDFHPSELASRQPAGVPDALALPLTATLWRMRGTDEAAPRCVALSGEIGVQVGCSIYASRPSPCRDFAPYAPLGIGDDACHRARRRHGLPPL
ncbi:MAG: YkgJ family cysteine cluster protein [Rhodocyclaceae bacterium]|nr:YkgJ family cysteine cluster protein [Rhodocyclaceae bacterium]